MKEPDEIFDVPVRLSDGTTHPGRFRIWEESPDSPDDVLVELTYDGRQLSAASALNFFDALLQIRRRLDAEGVLVGCYGCSRSVYPSPMALNMGYGEKAYKLYPGRQARTADLVSIFDTGSDVDPVTIDEQSAQYERWMQSIS